MRAHKHMATATNLPQPGGAGAGAGAAGDVAVGDSAADPEGAVLLTAAELLAQLADPTRLQLVRLLGTEEQDVTTLTGQVSASRSSVSQHLGRLRLAGLVAARRDGRRMLYRVTSGHLVELADQAYDLAEHFVQAVPRHHGQPSV
jgi:DNA-binding transcriptional ArsR family regulator